MKYNGPRFKSCDFFGVFLLILLVVLSLIFVVCQVWDIALSRRSEAWPQVMGELSVMVGPYRREVRYEYTVNSVRYSSDRVIFGEFGKRVMGKDYKTYAEMPNGARVVVCYMAEKPWVSTLVVGKVSEKLFMNMVVSVCFMLGGICGVLLLNKKAVWRVNNGDDRPW